MTSMNRREFLQLGAKAAGVVAVAAMLPQVATVSYPDDVVTDWGRAKLGRFINWVNVEGTWYIDCDLANTSGFLNETKIMQAIEQRKGGVG